MQIDKDTKLRDVLAEYPWLPDELIKADPAFKIIKSPIGKLMIKNATVADVMKKTGWTEEQLRAELDKYIAAHEANN